MRSISTISGSSSMGHRCQIRAWTKAHLERTIAGSERYEHNQVVPLAFEAAGGQHFEFSDCLANRQLLRDNKDAGYRLALPYAPYA